MALDTNSILAYSIENQTCALVFYQEHGSDFLWLAFLGIKVLYVLSNVSEHFPKLLSSSELYDMSIS